MEILVEIFVGAFLAGLAVGLIAGAISNVKCTALRENQDWPDRPIPMEHEHGGSCDGNH